MTRLMGQILEMLGAVYGIPPRSGLGVAQGELPERLVAPGA